MASAPRNIVILISGGGSNMAAIVQTAQRDHWQQRYGTRVAAVISNRADAGGLAFARDHGVDTAVIDHTEYADRSAFDERLSQEIDRHQPALVVLAGFMRILTPAFVAHFEGRLLNIHPSLLPKYRGLHTHARALAAGDAEHGASVHFVTPELDAGAVIAQVRLPVRAGDTPETLAARLLPLEHRLLVATVGLAVAGRLAERGDKACLDGQERFSPLCLDWSGKLRE